MPSRNQCRTGSAGFERHPRACREDEGRHLGDFNGCALRRCVSVHAVRHRSGATCLADGGRCHQHAATCRLAEGSETVAPAPRVILFCRMNCVGTHLVHPIRCRPGAVLICVNASEASQGSAVYMRWGPIKSGKVEVLMNSRSWVRLGCVFSVAASMLIGTMGVTKTQGAEI